jgi:hypothetical protein
MGGLSLRSAALTRRKLAGAGHPRAPLSNQLNGKKCRASVLRGCRGRDRRGHNAREKIAVGARAHRMSARGRRAIRGML